MSLCFLFALSYSPLLTNACVFLLFGHERCESFVGRNRSSPWCGAWKWEETVLAQGGEGHVHFGPNSPPNVSGTVYVVAFPVCLTDVIKQRVYQKIQYFWTDYHLAHGQTAPKKIATSSLVFTTGSWHREIWWTSGNVFITLANWLDSLWYASNRFVITFIHR